MKKKRLLLNGDAVMATGFARANHHISETLHHAWDLHILGINYWGDPHPYPYPIYPANPAQMGDAWGCQRVRELLPVLRPDVLLVHNDPWNVVEYVKRYARSLPVVAWMPVDGKNVKDGAALNGLAHAVFYTQFGLDEARKGGYAGPASVIGLGVDRSIYHPIPKAQARARTIPAGVLPPTAFIVGNVNRNQPRKRLDLTIAYFAEWVKTRRVNDAYLYLHLAPTGDKGWDVRQLAQYYGVQARLILPKTHNPGTGVPEEHLAHVYNTFDVQVNTGQGEGFGLTQLEGASCGVPQVFGKWAALPEWAIGQTAVPCTSTAATFNNINIIGGVPDRGQFIEALDHMYRHPDRRRLQGAAAEQLASAPTFHWPNLALRFDDVLQAAMTNEQQTPWTNAETREVELP